MVAPELPENERARLETLRDFEILDTIPEGLFDDLTRLAAAICEAPMAQLSFVDERRQWFKAKVGLVAEETSRDISFCGHAILGQDVFVVPDATRDERFRNNPMVIADPAIRFYAGAPLVVEDGIAVGALCVLDRQPRELRPSQLQALQVLARVIVGKLELRRRTRALRQLEVETANLRLLRRMADQLIGEIGNAMVSISTQQQLAAERAAESEACATLSAALQEGVSRVNRLLAQMRYLARDLGSDRERVPLILLLDESYHDALSHHGQGVNGGTFQNGCADEELAVAGDRAALRHAFAEVFLNALQARPDAPRIVAQCRLEKGAAGTETAVVEILDNGPGFTPNSAEQAFTPFFTSRIPGVGLGLTVARKIVEGGGGEIEIPEPLPDQPGGRVRVRLPRAAAA